LQSYLRSHAGRHHDRVSARRLLPDFRVVRGFFPCALLGPPTGPYARFCSSNLGQRGRQVLRGGLPAQCASNPGQDSGLTAAHSILCIHVRPARSIFSNALNFYRSAIAALVCSPWRYYLFCLPGGPPLSFSPPC